MGMIDTGATTSVIADSVTTIPEIAKRMRSCEHRITVADDRSIVFDQEIPNC